MQLELWTYRQPMKAVDLTEFRVEATDGSIGKVDEATSEMGASYIIVDTGPWIFGKKVMLPAGAVTRIDMDDRRIYVDLIKDEIRSAPEFDQEGYRSAEYREQLGTHYTRFHRTA